MPTQRLARWVLMAGALAFAASGIGFLLAPEAFGRAVDLALLPATSDVRAVFGGLELGLAVACTAAALRGHALRPALSLLLRAVGDMLAGRAIGLALDDPPGPFA